MARDLNQEYVSRIIDTKALATAIAKDIKYTDGDFINWQYFSSIKYAYFKNIIYPELRSQKNILISAHGNSLRALIMYLEKISEDKIVKLEIATGQPIVFKLDEDLKVIAKEIL